MSKRIVMTTILGAALTIAGNASAGYKWGANVSITMYSDGSGRASGAFGSARSSIYPYEEIAISGYPTYTYCIATDYRDVTVNCFTQDPNMLALLRSANSDSYLYFAWDVYGRCSSLQVLNDSATPPKQT